MSAGVRQLLLQQDMDGVRVGNVASCLIEQGFD